MIKGLKKIQTKEIFDFIKMADSKAEYWLDQKSTVMLDIIQRTCKLKIKYQEN